MLLQYIIVIPKKVEQCIYVHLQYFGGGNFSLFYFCGDDGMTVNTLLDYSYNTAELWEQLCSLLGVLARSRLF